MLEANVIDSMVFKYSARLNFMDNFPPYTSFYQSLILSAALTNIMFIFYRLCPLWEFRGSFLFIK